MHRVYMYTYIERVSVSMQNMYLYYPVDLHTL